MVGRGEHLLHEVLFFRGHPDDPARPTPLQPVGFQGLALDVVIVGHADHHVHVRDEVLSLKLLGFPARDPGAPRVAILLFHLQQFRAHRRHDQLRPSRCGVAQHLLIPGDVLDQQFVLFLNLLALQRGQALQSHL